jgi:chaperonin GroEL
MGVEKRIVYGRDARRGILNGILKSGRAVTSTFGPKGRLSVVYKGSTPYTTRDGAKTIQAISFRDELENIGASLMKEVCTKANYSNGDGSTTVVILASTLCETAERLLDDGLDVNVIVKEFKTALEDVLSKVESQRIPVGGEADLKKIALISAHGDDDIASTVIKAFTGIGEDGIVALADSLSRKGKSDVVFSTGCDFERGFLSSASVNTKSDTCELKDPLVLVTSKPVDSFETIIPFLQYAQDKEQPIVFIAPDFDDSAVAGFVGNLSKKTLQGAMILAPGTSKSDIKDRIRDLNVLLGGRVLGDDVEIDQFSMKDDFGRCDQIIVHAGKTEIIEPNTDEAKFAEHVAALKVKIELDDVDEAYTEFEIEKIKSRIAHMEGGVATIKVGGLTQMELDEKKDRYEDAINAVRAVIKEGMVPGGGVALLRSAFELDTGVFKGTAYNAFLDAIKEPFRALVRSAGCSVENAIISVLSPKNKKGSVIGFDASDATVKDISAVGIMDAAKVIKNDLIYAESVAETFTTLDVAIISDLGSLSMRPVDESFQDYFGGVK